LAQGFFRRYNGFIETPKADEAKSHTRVSREYDRIERA
jgi:hypothetical protein